jgi:hypothetical protein
MPKPNENKENKQTWAALVAHVGRGEEAIDLLEKIFCDVGPYQQDQIAPETWSKVRDFFDFDDSE